MALGQVATSGSTPALGDVYCVKSSYTSYGSSSNWGYVWKDHGSGASSDVSIVEARTSSSDLQSVRGFGAVANYNYYPSSPYFLKKESHTYWAEKPVEKMIMYNVQYDLESEKQQTAPVKVSPTIVDNNSDIQQSVARTISYSIAESSSFTFSQAIQLGIAMEITAGSPLIGIEQTTTISASTTSEFTTGDTTTKEHTDSIEVSVDLPPKSRITAVITGTEYKADIPYTASVKKIYFDGSTGYATISGVYKGVTVAEIKVTYGEIEYFE